MGTDSAWAPAGQPDAAALRLVPIVARVIESGRGAPDLVRWVEGRVADLGGNPGADPRRGRALVLRVAGELARLLPAAGPGDTLAARTRLTLREP